MDDRWMYVSVTTGVMILAWFIVKLAKRVHAKAGMPKRLIDFQSEVERAAIATVHASMHLAECEAELVDLIVKAPVAYNSAIYQALSVARLIEQRSFEDSEAFQTYARRRFDPNYRGEENVEISSNVEPIPDEGPSQQVRTKLAVVPDFEEIGGVLVPRVRKPERRL